MTNRVAASSAIIAVTFALVATTQTTVAAELPPIKTSAINKIPECATPGRLMAYLKTRNGKLNAKYDGIASEYMRHGEELSLRWDYAFFQMLLETGYLTYKGDVKPEQNNFAGLGASGGGARGESFKDVSTGARAHLEHLAMYSGEKIANPTAKRTRDVQEWGVLTDWQKSFNEPITFAQLAKQWAPSSKGYASDIRTIADRFFDGPCKDADPQPELVAAAKGVGSTPAAESAAASIGADLARRAREQDRTAGDTTQAALAGGTSDEPAKTPDAAAAADAAQPPQKSPPVSVINTAPPAQGTDRKAEKVEKTDKADKPAKTEKAAALETASVAGAAAAGIKADKDKKAGKSSSGCRVWTASYGGSKAIIIKAVAEQTINYTVLDVNEGSEKRETDAYINAYAKGGERVGDYTSQSQALDKAFQLCPEG